MKTTIKCDQPGCDYTKSVNSDYAKQTLGRHKLFTHGIKGTSKAAIDRERKKAKARKSEVEETASEEQPQKRKYTKRAAAPLSVALCPLCGCNIHAVNVALNLRR